MTFCNGCGCLRKYKCKRWLGHKERKDAKRRDGVKCFEVKGQLNLFNQDKKDYFIIIKKEEK